MKTSDNVPDALRPSELHFVAPKSMVQDVNPRIGPDLLLDSILNDSHEREGRITSALRLLAESLGFSNVSLTDIPLQLGIQGPFVGRTDLHAFDTHVFSAILGGPTANTELILGATKATINRQMAHWCSVLELSSQPFTSFASHGLIDPNPTLPADSVHTLEDKLIRLGLAPEIWKAAAAAAIPWLIILTVILLRLLLRWLLRWILRLLWYFWKWLFRRGPKSSPGDKPGYITLILWILNWLRKLFAPPPVEPIPPLPPLTPPKPPPPGAGPGAIDDYKKTLRERIEGLTKSIENLEREIAKILIDVSLSQTTRAQLLAVREATKKALKEMRSKLEAQLK